LLKEIGRKKSTRLIDDNILSIIPIDPYVFSDPDDKRKVSFLPFYNSIKEKFKNEALLPSTDGYVSSQNAYWAANTQLPSLFSNKQLQNIVDNENGRWVFVSLGRDELQRNNKPLFSYVESLVKTNLNEDAIICGRSKDYFYNRLSGERQYLDNIRGITAEFIEMQPIFWLHKFYKWLAETKHRTDISKDKPIFLDSNSKAAAAYDNNQQLIMFLPVNNIENSEYTVVNPQLLLNKHTRSFLEEIGVKEPSLKDQIYNIILPQYTDKPPIETDTHFILFFKYYYSCPNDEMNNFINMIKDYEFLNYYTNDNPKLYHGKANSMYLPAPDVNAYFETKKGVRFIALKKYIDLVGEDRKDRLLSFLIDLGAKEYIDVITVQIDYLNSDRKDLPYHYSTRGSSWEENVIEGCKEIIAYIVKNKDKSKSVLLWNCLLKVINKNCNNWGYHSISNLLSGKYQYFYYSLTYESFISSDAILLKQSNWMFNNDDEFVVPSIMGQFSRQKFKIFIMN
jgi:hypothetical protein